MYIVVLNEKIIIKAFRLALSDSWTPLYKKYAIFYLRTAPGVTKVVNVVFWLPNIGSSNYRASSRRQEKQNTIVSCHKSTWQYKLYDSQRCHTHKMDKPLSKPFTVHFLTHMTPHQPANSTPWLAGHANVCILMKSTKTMYYSFLYRILQTTYDI